MPAHLEMIGRALRVHPLVGALGTQQRPHDTRDALVELGFKSFSHDDYPLITCEVAVAALSA
jgi:hypothetical protein